MNGGLLAALFASATTLACAGQSMTRPALSAGLSAATAPSAVSESDDGESQASVPSTSPGLSPVEDSGQALSPFDQPRPEPGRRLRAGSQSSVEAEAETCLEVAPRSPVLGMRGEVLRGDPNLPLVALTFDAGAGAGAVRQLLDTLREKEVRSTFFVAGAFADRYPGVVARIAEEGHELANHSYSHPDFRSLSQEQMRQELRRAAAAISAAAGGPLGPLWRPPFGGRDDRVLRTIEEEGYRSIYWTLDSGDWIEGATEQRIRQTVLERATPGAIVVHHVSPTATTRAMPAIVDGLRQRGYELVTVSELLDGGSC